VDAQKKQKVFIAVAAVLILGAGSVAYFTFSGSGEQRRATSNTGQTVERKARETTGDTNRNVRRSGRSERRTTSASNVSRKERRKTSSRSVRRKGKKRGKTKRLKKAEAKPMG
jgi:hypothetical protein